MAFLEPLCKYVSLSLSKPFDHTLFAYQGGSMCPGVCEEVRV